MLVNLGYFQLPKLIILTGPQGSGNHLFSKILALNPVVYGWEELLTEYWIGHDKEPFSEMWQEPELLHDFNWGFCEYYVTSISCPYALNGEYVIPDYAKFIDIASKYADIKIAIISRDINIVRSQQERVRDKVTFPEFYKNLNLLTKYPHMFVNHEAVNMYGHWYISYFFKELGLPDQYIISRANAEEILVQNANKKYIKDAQEQLLDMLAKKASEKWR